ncbi:MAG: hypothetical protein SH859_11040 [Hyphomicrobium aestuarii]|nr:hypothetical protein [Hyphomicrobium aestuarii]
MATKTSNLADLLDRFTGSINAPETQTIGAFAETVQALHAEFALLARHFEAVAERAITADHDEFGMEHPVAPIQSDDAGELNVSAVASLEA